jgi:hypothetical protein
MAVDLHEVREIALSLPRTEEHLIRRHVKFRVGRIVYASVSPDEEIMGFGYPREERGELGTPLKMILTSICTAFSAVRCQPRLGR